MAVATFSTWADNTEQTVLAARCKVTAIEVQPHPRQANDVFLALYDAVNPNTGVDAPRFVFPVTSLTNSGGGVLQQTDGIAYGSLKKKKVVFPGGLLFATACTVFLATTSGGGTAPTTTSLPGRVKIYYTVGS